MKKYLTLCCLLQIGCGLPELRSRDRIAISDKFSAEQTELVISSLEQWCVATDGGICPSYYIGEFGDEWQISTVRLEKHSLGVTRPRIKFIGLDLRQLNPRESYVFECAILHELGHAMGMPFHIESSPLMMASPGTYVTCIDASAIRNLCALRDCGDNWGPTCK